jgi:hypothetical protein
MLNHNEEEATNHFDLNGSIALLRYVSLLWLLHSEQNKSRTEWLLLEGTLLLYIEKENRGELSATSTHQPPVRVYSRPTCYLLLAGQSQ